MNERYLHDDGLINLFFFRPPAIPLVPIMRPYRCLLLTVAAICMCARDSVVGFYTATPRFAASGITMALLPKKSRPAAEAEQPAPPTTPRPRLLGAARRRPRATTQEDEEEEDATESAAVQLANLEAAANANRSEWQEMLAAKLAEWKEMKVRGEVTLVVR